MEATEKRKQLLLLSALILLTLALMIFFKYNSSKMTSLIKSGQDNLLAFYANSLKPIFEPSEITNKDVFNFAISGTLPLDSAKTKILKLDNPDNGEIVYTIEDLKAKPLNEDYYDSFITSQKLNEKEIAGLDSLLNNYKSDLFISVMKGDSNSYAINKSMKEVLASLRLDLQKFDFNKNAGKFNPTVAVKLDSVKNLLRTQIAAEKNKYLLVTPDTLVNIIAEVNNSLKDAFNSEEFKNAFRSFKVSTGGLNSLSPESRVIFDSSSIRISVADSLDIRLESLANNFLLNVTDSNKFVSLIFSADTSSGKLGFSVFGKEKDSAFAVDMNLDAGKLTEFIGASIATFSKVSNANDEAVEEKLDSLMRKYKFLDVDTAKSNEEIIKIKNKIKNLQKRRSSK